MFISNRNEDYLLTHHCEDKMGREMQGTVKGHECCTNRRHGYFDTVFPSLQGDGRAAGTRVTSQEASHTAYLKELAEEETCSREARTAPGVTGRKRFFGLQRVLKSVISQSDPLGLAGR